MEGEDNNILQTLNEMAVSCACPSQYEGDSIDINLIQGQGTEKERILNDTIRLYWSETLQDYVSIMETRRRKDDIKA